RLKGRIGVVKKGAPTAHVKVDIGGQTVTAAITNESVEELKLAPGQPAYAVIKARRDDRHRLDSTQHECRSPHIARRYLGRDAGAAACTGCERDRRRRPQRAGAGACRARLSGGTAGGDLSLHARAR